LRSCRACVGRLVRLLCPGGRACTPTPLPANSFWLQQTPRSTGPRARSAPEAHHPPAECALCSTVLLPGARFFVRWLWSCYSKRIECHAAALEGRMNVAVNVHRLAERCAIRLNYPAMWRCIAPQMLSNIPEWNFFVAEPQDLR